MIKSKKQLQYLQSEREQQPESATEKMVGIKDPIIKA